mgnify:CR=1 FL=1
MPLHDPITPAEFDMTAAVHPGVVFGKGKADPNVEEDVQDVSFTFTVEHINSIFVVCSSTMLPLH